MQGVTRADSPLFNRFSDYWPSIFVGGKGTSSLLHKDWAGTSAWMALLVGEKEFIIVPGKDQSERDRSGRGRGRRTRRSTGGAGGEKKDGEDGEEGEEGKEEEEEGWEYNPLDRNTHASLYPQKGNANSYRANLFAPFDCLDNGVSTGNGTFNIANGEQQEQQGNQQGIHQEECGQAYPLSLGIQVYKDTLHKGELIYLPAGLPHQARNNAGLTVAIAGNMVRNDDHDLSLFRAESVKLGLRTAGSEALMYAGVVRAVDRMMAERRMKKEEDEEQVNAADDAVAAEAVEAAGRSSVSSSSPSLARRPPARRVRRATAITWEAFKRRGGG